MGLVSFFIAAQLSVPLAQAELPDNWAGLFTDIAGPSVVRTDDPNVFVVAAPLESVPPEWSLQVNNSDVEYRLMETASGYAVALRVQEEREFAITAHLMSSVAQMRVEPLELVSPGYFDLNLRQMDPPQYTELAIDSVELDNERTAYFYMPDGAEPGELAAVIYSGDGLAASRFARIVEALTVRGEIAPIAIASTGTVAEYIPDIRTDRRSAEYVYIASDRRDDERSRIYDSHHRFFQSEFLPLVEREYLSANFTGDRILFGTSASASFALSYFLRAEDHDIDAVLAASPVIGRSIVQAFDQSDSQTNISIVCGEWESDVCGSASALVPRDPDESVLYVERPANHSTTLWEEAFATYLRTRYPPSDRRH